MTGQRAFELRLAWGISEASMASRLSSQTATFTAADIRLFEDGDTNAPLSAEYDGLNQARLGRTQGS
jgi:hypothetical protein